MRGAQANSVMVLYFITHFILFSFFFLLFHNFSHVVAGTGNDDVRALSEPITKDSGNERQIGLLQNTAPNVTSSRSDK